MLCIKATFRGGALRRQNKRDKERVKSRQKVICAFIIFLYDLKNQIKDQNIYGMHVYYHFFVDFILFN